MTRKTLRSRLKKLRKHLFAISTLTLLIVIVRLFNHSTSVIKEDRAYEEYFRDNYRIFGLSIPDSLDFCGEQVPISDFSVRESLDRELLVNTYWQSQTLLFHKRANRWFSVIEPILEENNIPDDFKYLAVAESGLKNSISPARATGFWQFMERTGKQYGLEINDEVDERYDVRKSTIAACKYFKAAYNRFNDWTLVAASYNMGMGGLNKQLTKQKVDSYYDLLLNRETGRYVFRILAIKEILSRPKEYGFIFREKDLYPAIPTISFEVDTAISSLTDFAIQQNTTYKVLKIFNPWLRRDYLKNTSQKTYTIHLPKNHVDSVYINQAKEILLSDSLTSPDTSFRKSLREKVNTLDSVSVNENFYFSLKGENLESIAKKLSVTAQELAIWNKRSLKDSLPENTKLVLLNTPSDTIKR